MATKKVKKSTSKKVAEAKAAVAAVDAATVTPKETVKESKVRADVPVATPMTEPELQRLRKMNLWLALAFGVQAIAVVLFGGSKAVPVIVNYLAPDQLASEINGHQVLGVASRHIADLRLTVVAAGFLVLFGLASLALATIGRAHYEARLRRGSNVGRWLVFGLGGGGVIVALALESGIYSIATLLILFVSMLMCGALEPLAEKFKATETKNPVLAHAMCAAALVAGLVPWAVFAIGVVGAMAWNGKIPGSLYFMYGTTLVLLLCWLMGTHFRVTKRGKWTDTLYAEKMYMFLTLASATVLAWQIFAGAV
jgi:hypothetical protein